MEIMISAPMVRGEKMSNYYIRVLETEDWIIEYSPVFREYRVSYFEDGHFKDMVVFKEYEKCERTNMIPKMNV
jgi:hypothetical protein